MGCAEIGQEEISKKCPSSETPISIAEACVKTLALNIILIESKAW